jgi:hypothetical protein
MPAAGIGSSAERRALSPESEALLSALHSLARE